MTRPMFTFNRIIGWTIFLIVLYGLAQTIGILPQ
jgi:hypothetical protein